MTTVFLEKDDHGRVSIRFNYNPDLVAKINEIKSRSWRPDKKYRTVPDTEPTLELLSAILRNENALSIRH